MKHFIKHAPARNEGPTLYQSRELGFLFIDQTTYLYNPFGLSYDKTPRWWSAKGIVQVTNRR